jgi:hypothetical protein
MAVVLTRPCRLGTSQTTGPGSERIRTLV